MPLCKNDKFSHFLLKALKFQPLRANFCLAKNEALCKFVAKFTLKFEI